MVSGSARGGVVGVPLAITGSCLTRGMVFDGLDNPSGHWHALLGYGLATAVAFWLTFAAYPGSAPSAPPSS